MSVWVAYDEYEYDPDSWLTGPDDDFVPAPYNTVSWCYENHNDVTWEHVMSVSNSWDNCPGHHTIHVFPAA